MHKKILLFLMVLLCVPTLAFAQTGSAAMGNPEIVKTMRVNITQTGEITVAGSASDLYVNVSIPVEDGFQKVESMSVNYDYKLTADKFGNRFVQMHWDKPPGKIEYVVSMVVSTSRRIGGVSRSEPEFSLPTEHAESNDQKIVDFASQFNGSDFERIASVTKWIHSNVKYNIDLFDVDETAVQTLDSREGVCDEITNLLLASARAMGYSSAAVFGWAIGENRTEPHSWAEIYAPSGVIQVDATWAEAGFLDAAHIKYATIPDTLFATGGARASVSGGGKIELVTGNTKIEVLEFIQEPLVDSASVVSSINPRAGGDVVIDTDLSYGGCILTDFYVQSCEVDGKPFLSASTPSQIIYFCDNAKMSSILKIPGDISSDAVYNCPVSVYSHAGETEVVDVQIGSDFFQSLINSIIRFFRSLFGG